MSYEDNFDLNADKQISDYILHDEIGSGGFAKVVKGIHIPTGEKVAVKIMNKIQLFTDPLNLRRVKTEISILKLVRHKNIIKLYEVIETPQKIYLIMEYCEGGELFDYIVQKQHLTERQACAFFHEIIDALEYLHSINIVHRDIKPENLLLDKINKKISLKLIDFGISNIYNMQNLLKTPCGTASYAPPEMHKGEKYYGLLTDIWSSGVVLYAMAFGYLPFCDDDEEINVTNIIEGNYEIPSSASPELYDLLIHLLDINPLTRYDIDQIKVHPWYNMISTNTNRPGLIVGYHKIPIDERIINVCQTYGYDANKVRESVINNSYDNNSSIYYIILNKMKAMGIESISDLNSPEFLNYINDPKNIFFSKTNLINNNPNLTNENKNTNNRNNNNILKNGNHINLQLVTSFDSNNSSKNNKQKVYENIFPANNIQFCINSNEETENQIKINNKEEEKDIQIELEKRNESAPNIPQDLINTDKEEKINNLSDKNNIYKKKIGTSNRNKDKKKKLFIVSQIIDIPSENIKKKESKKIAKTDNNNNNLVFQTNKTFYVKSKYQMNYDDKSLNEEKRNESFDKKLTDDIKEKILKLRNPKKNQKKQKINEAQLKLQLKINRIKKNKNNLNNKKIAQKVPIINKDRKKHTIIHNRNASATPHRYRYKNNNININYFNNNININNIYIKKVREQSSSPQNKHIKHNSSIIKYQKINKDQHPIINYIKNANKNNFPFSLKKYGIGGYEKSFHDSSIMNISVRHINNKNININNNPRLSGPKKYFKILNKTNKEIILDKNDKIRNTSTNKRKIKDTPKSLHFLSFLKNNNKSMNKRTINQSSIIKNTCLNDSNSHCVKKNGLLHSSFNRKNNYHTLTVENGKKEKKKIFINNLKKYNIKNKLYRKEIDENISFVEKGNRLSNCLSPVSKEKKENKAFLNISNNKKKNKNMEISLLLNSNKKINHNKCNSMKYVESNSSFNYDINYTQKFHNYKNLNNSYRERDKKNKKEKSNEKSILSNKKGCASKRKLMNLFSFKLKNSCNYKSNFTLKKNIIAPKKYNGPIDFKYICIANNANIICDEIENILKKNCVNSQRTNSYKIICWKNSDMIEINVYSISGFIKKNAKYKIKINLENIDNSVHILDVDSNNFDSNYNNTYSTAFYKTEGGNNNLKNKINVQKNMFYINIITQKDKKNKAQLDLINKIINNKYSLIKNYKK